MRCKPLKKAMLAFMGMFFLLAGIGVLLSTISVAKEAREIGRNDVQGKVLSIRTNIFGGGVIEVKSDLTEKVYTFRVGMNTTYNPNRGPLVGETIKVTYFNEKGELKASRIQIVKSLK